MSSLSMWLKVFTGSLLVLLITPTVWTLLLSDQLDSSHFLMKNAGETSHVCHMTSVVYHVILISCSFPGADDFSLFQKFERQHKNHAHFSTPQLKQRNPVFTISHYASSVTYAIEVKHMILLLSCSFLKFGNAYK